MSIMMRRKHPKATRILASFSLAIGSRFKIVENFKPIVLRYLHIIFDKTMEVLQGDNFNESMQEQNTLL